MSYFNYIQVFFFGKKNRRIGFFCFLFSLFLFASCNNYHCKEPMYVPLVVSFYSDADTSKQLEPHFLEIKGVGNDSIFQGSEKYDRRARLLSLKKFENSTAFVFTSTYKNEGGESISVVDTLTIRHTNTQIFVSAECGCLTTFRLDEIRHTNNNITDFLITNRFVTSNYNERHIRIYFENH